MHVQNRGNVSCFKITGQKLRLSRRPFHQTTLIYMKQESNTALFMSKRRKSRTN